MFFCFVLKFQKYVKILLNLALVIIGSTTTSADDLSCPFNAKGTHPKCICNNDNPYDEVNRICATVLDAQYLLAKCPKGKWHCGNILNEILTFESINDDKFPFDYCVLISLIMILFKKFKEVKAHFRRVFV